jgi:hypothetical protein
MKRPHDHEHYQRLLSTVGSLFKNIQASDHHDHVADFVMHQLCNESGFNLNRAAYLVDNPDFDCVQGVTGYCKDEMGKKSFDIWKNKPAFEQHVCASRFNQDVKNFKHTSVLRSGQPHADAVHAIADTLHIDNPAYYTWDMKHDNHGIFVYQKQDVPGAALDHLQDTVCLLGFCPLF